MTTILRNVILNGFAMRSIAFILTLLLTAAAHAQPATQPAPPKLPTGSETNARQPERATKGPGSADYAHQAINKVYLGSGDTACHVFQPARPKPEAAPVVIFLHGWRGVNPVIYGGWIRHLILRGNIVIFPRYQDDVTQPRMYSPNVNTAVRVALDYLEKTDGTVRPDKTKVAVIGHSCGGILAANYAATAARESLPVPLAVMCVEPGKSGFFELADLTKISPDTLLLTLAGDLDKLVGDSDARKIFEGATAVKKENRNMLLMRSDTHGSPAMWAGHLSPLSLDLAFEADVPKSNPEAKSFLTAMAPRSQQGAGMGTDAVDYNGFWRLGDALIHAAFTGKDREKALGDTPQQRDMGKWSDGKPVKQPVVFLAR